MKGYILRHISFDLKLKMNVIKILNLLVGFNNWIYSFYAFYDMILHFVQL